VGDKGYSGEDDISCLAFACKENYVGEGKAFD